MARLAVLGARIPDISEQIRAMAPRFSGRRGRSYRPLDGIGGTTVFTFYAATLAKPSEDSLLSLQN